MAWTDFGSNPGLSSNCFLVIQKFPLASSPRISPELPASPCSQLAKSWSFMHVKESTLPKVACLSGRLGSISFGRPAFFDWRSSCWSHGPCRRQTEFRSAILSWPTCTGTVWSWRCFHALVYWEALCEGSVKCSPAGFIHLFNISCSMLYLSTWVFLCIYSIGQSTKSSTLTSCELDDSPGKFAQQSKDTSWFVLRLGRETKESICICCCLCPNKL